MDRHTTPVVDGIDQACLTGSSSDHSPGFSRTSRDRGDATQATEAPVISALQQTGCLREERGQHRCSHARHGGKNRHIPRRTSRRGRITSRIGLLFSKRSRGWSLPSGERCEERFHGVYRLADLLLNQRKLLLKQPDRMPGPKPPPNTDSSARIFRSVIEWLVTPQIVTGSR